MTAETASAFDLDQLRRAIEARDAAAQAAMFADDAEVLMFDVEHPPSNPMRVQGRDAIRAMLDDVFSRDMTHKVEHALQDGDQAAYTVACKYAEGPRVRLNATLDLRDGRIAHEEIVQAWDA